MKTNRSTGFTLIELLVVLIIIGVLATMVSLAVSGRAVDDRMQAESRRLEQLLRLASDEAQAKGLELGLRMTTEGFEFLAPDTESGRWEVVGEGLFRPREVPEPFFLELQIDGRRIQPVRVKSRSADAQPSDADEKKPAGSGDDKAPAIEPQLLILSTGEMTAFTLDLKLKDNATAYRLEGNEMGELKSYRLAVRS